MNLSKVSDLANDLLKGVPSTILSGLLLCFAAFAVYVAFRGTPALKITGILWFLLP